MSDKIQGLDERMKAAGMIPLSSLLAGSPMDCFHRHAGVNDIDTFEQWLKLRLEETMSMKCRMILDKKEDDELYEWALAHAAVFNEVMINFKAATQKTDTGE